jgi:hypothetical protein
MIAGIRQALAGHGSPHASPALLGLLARLDEEGLRAAGEAATLPEGIASVPDNRQMGERIVGATPFAALPAALQSEIKTSLARIDAGHFTLPASNLADLERSQVGVAVGETNAHLVVVDPDGSNIWVSPSERIPSAMRPGPEADMDQAAEVAHAVLHEELVITPGLPRDMQQRKLRFPAALHRTELPAMLESLAKQTGLPFLADDYLRSRESVFTWLLADRQEYSLAEALRQVASAFGHRFVYKNGVMHVETLTPGLDLRAEPPAELLETLRQRAAHKELLSFEDQLALGTLSDLQLLTMMTRHPPVIPQLAVLYTLYQSRGVLRFYGGLTPEQQSRAATTAGLPPRDLDLGQHAVFTRLSSVGLPGKPAAGAAPKTAGFYVTREPAGEKGEVVSMRIVAEGASRDYTYQFAPR